MHVNEYRTSESGSVLSFVLIGLLLVGLLAGGLYAIYGRSAQIANTPAVSSQDSDDQKPADQSKPADSKDQTTPAKDAQPQDTENKPDPNAKPTPAPAPPNQTPQAPIANSGPTETALTTIVLGATTAAATMYVQSRRFARN